MENAKEAVLEVDCNNITNISSAMEQYKNQLVQTLVQEHSDKSISLETVSLTIQLLPEIDDMEDRLSEERSYGTIGNNRKAWVAAFIRGKAAPCVLSAVGVSYLLLFLMPVNHSCFWYCRDNIWLQYNLLFLHICII